MGLSDQRKINIIRNAILIVRLTILVAMAGLAGTIFGWTYYTVQHFLRK